MAIKLTGKLEPNNATLDTYPTHEDIYGKGGFMVIDSTNSTIADKVPAERRKVGMLIYDTKDSKYYRCTNTNGTFTEVIFGSRDQKVFNTVSSTFSSHGFGEVITNYARRLPSNYSNYTYNGITVLTYLLWTSLQSKVLAPVYPIETAFSGSISSNTDYYFNYADIDDYEYIDFGLIPNRVKLPPAAGITNTSITIHNINPYRYIDSSWRSSILGLVDSFNIPVGESIASTIPKIPTLNNVNNKPHIYALAEGCSVTFVAFNNIWYLTNYTEAPRLEYDTTNISLEDYTFVIKNRVFLLNIPTYYNALSAKANYIPIYLQTPVKTSTLGGGTDLTVTDTNTSVAEVATISLNKQFFKVTGPSPSATISLAAIAADGALIPNTYSLMADGAGNAVWAVDPIVAHESDIDHDLIETALQPDSPNMTGTPTATTADIGDDSTRIATTEYVLNAVANYTTPAKQVKTFAIVNSNYDTNNDGYSYNSYNGMNTLVTYTDHDTNLTAWTGATTDGWHYVLDGLNSKIKCIISGVSYLEELITGNANIIKLQLERAIAFPISDYTGNLTIITCTAKNTREDTSLLPTAIGSAIVNSVNFFRYYIHLPATTNSNTEFHVINNNIGSDGIGYPILLGNILSNDSSNVLSTVPYLANTYLIPYGYTAKVLYDSGIFGYTIYEVTSKFTDEESTTLTGSNLTSFPVITYNKGSYNNITLNTGRTVETYFINSSTWPNGYLAWLKDNGYGLGSVHYNTMDAANTAGATSYFYGNTGATTYYGILGGNGPGPHIGSKILFDTDVFTTDIERIDLIENSMPNITSLISDIMQNNTDYVFIFDLASLSDYNNNGTCYVRFDFPENSGFYPGSTITITNLSTLMIGLNSFRFSTSPVNKINIENDDLTFSRIYLIEPKSTVYIVPKPDSPDWTIVSNNLLKLPGMDGTTNILAYSNVANEGHIFIDENSNFRYSQYIHIRDWITYNAQ